MQTATLFFLLCLSVLCLCTDATGNQKKQILQCRSGRRLCFIDPCKTEKCPNFPHAKCIADYCNCQAIFLDKNERPIPKFACPVESNWPQCLQPPRRRYCAQYLNRCSAGCPGVPNAVCHQDCNCRTVFTNDRNGNVLNERDCHPVRQCPPLVTSNTMVSYQIKCTKGRKVGSLCRLSCNGGKVLFGGVSRVVCLKGGRWSRSLKRASCGFDNRCPDVKPFTLIPKSGQISKVFPLPACYVCPSKCPRGQICCPSRFCGSSCAPIPKACPNNKRRHYCPLSPCLYRRCYGHPKARCSNHYCGGCGAVFTDPTTNEVVPQFACRRGANWPGCLAKKLCPNNEKECASGCPLVPTARCIQDCNCKTIFIDSSTGRTLSSKQCSPIYDKRCPVVEPGQVGICTICPKTCPKGQICCPTGCGSTCTSILPPVRTCPSPYNRRVPVSFRLSCTEGYKIGSRCNVLCPKGKSLRGVSKIECLASGKWTEQLGNTQCVPNTICPPKVPIVNCLVSPCELATCPGVPDATCVENFCGGCNFDFFLGGRKVNPKRCSPTNRRCPTPFHIFARLSFRLICTNKYEIGSRCDVACPVGTFLRGITQIQCLPSGQWNEKLGSTQCIPKIICPPGVPQAKCSSSPCKSAKCPGVPQAACVDNFCGGCNFDFYLGGKKVDRKKCLPKQPCPYKHRRPLCRDVCKTSKCQTFTDAICKMDCYCQPKFYDPKTLEELICKQDTNDKDTKDNQHTTDDIETDDDDDLSQDKDGNAENNSDNQDDDKEGNNQNQTDDVDESTSGQNEDDADDAESTHKDDYKNKEGYPYLKDDKDEGDK